MTRTPAENELLVGVLGEQDAVWLPLRDWSESRPGLTYLARAAFTVRGVDYFSGARDVTARKRFELQMKAAEKRGLVKLFREKGRAVTLKLTDAGEAAARLLAGVPGVGESRAAVCELARTAKRKPRTYEDHWVSETVLARHSYLSPGDPPGAWDCSPFLAVEDRLLPAFSRGWVNSASDTAGRVYYALTPAGWLVADEGAPPTDPAPESPVELWDIYTDRMRQALARLTGERPRELGYIPLPVAHAGCPLTMDHGHW